jgi:polysaccharide pyruvyl transferase WcaK-like protein
MTGFIAKIGWSRLVIGLLLIALLFGCPFAGVSYQSVINDLIGRFGTNLFVVTGCTLEKLPLAISPEMSIIKL